MNLTKRVVETIELPQAKKNYYKLFRDSKLPGFCLRVSNTGIKTFVIDKKVHGKLIRFKIGRYGELTVERARKLAQKYLGELAGGANPFSERKKAKQSQVTLKHALIDYLAVRKTLKPRTRKDYADMLPLYFPDWQDKPLISITKDMVIKRHASIGERTQANANNALKLLSAVFNFAIAQYEDAEGNNKIKNNPVEHLSRIRAWYSKKRRRTKIENYQLGQWFQAVNELHDPGGSRVVNSVKHFLLLLLFTGLRKGEALRLIWSDRQNSSKAIAKTEHILDLNAKTIYIPDPKNRQPHHLPLSDYLYKLFSAYRQQVNSKFVFPNSQGDKPFYEPRKVMNHVIEGSGVPFILHDLRRTFASIAESLDMSAYALKRLLNHKIIGADVTAGYIVTDIDRLKVPMQKITDRILEIVSKRLRDF